MNKPKEKNTEVNRKYLKLLIFAIISLLLVGGVIFTFFEMRQAMFSRNKRFTLRRIELVSNGYWNRKSFELANVLNLKINEDNIFALSLADLKKKAMEQPSIERCKLTRIVPDTLSFEIIERIPRAQISRHPAFVVDGEGVIMPRNKCMPFANNLPVIFGVANQRRFNPGEIAPEFKNGLDLLMIVIRNFSDFKVIAIDVKSPDIITFYFYYRNGQRKKAIIPSTAKGTEQRLKALTNAIIASPDKNTFNLSFDGRVVCQ